MVLGFQVMAAAAAVVALVILPHAVVLAAVAWAFSAKVAVVQGVLVAQRALVAVAVLGARRVLILLLTRGVQVVLMVAVVVALTMTARLAQQVQVVR